MALTEDSFDAAILTILSFCASFIKNKIIVQNFDKSLFTYFIVDFWGESTDINWVSIW